MTSCFIHPERPAVATIANRHVCYSCDRGWHEKGYFAQVGTHPQGGDAKLAPGDSLSDAVANGHAPKPTTPREDHNGHA